MRLLLLSVWNSCFLTTFLFSGIYSLKSWLVDQVSKKDLVDLPFDRDNLFGRMLEEIIKNLPF